jgi:putative oxidoreductase
MQTLTMGLGRLLLGALFLVAGAHKFMGWEGTLVRLQDRGFPVTDIYGYPASQLILGAVIALEVIGALMLITGVGGRIAAVALAAFTLASGVIFHDFWAAEPAQYMNQFNHFLKNVAIIGGLLVVAAQPSAEDRYHD